MPYSEDHKKRTRRRIVHAASRLFRRRGYRRTSVDALMADAGLTRGGFYAHFRGKSELFAEALRASFAESKDNLLANGLEDARGDAWLDAAARRYLRAAHRSHPDRGCAIPSLGQEVAGAPRSVRKVFETELETLIEQLAARVGGPHPRETAIRALTTWVGAMLLGRAVTREDLIEEIFAAARRR
jgi:TetR/AcrR family transcriptional repressor of nem operon